LLGTAGTQALFEAAGLSAYWRAPPQDMVDEADVARLHAVLRQRLGAAVAGQVARRAGERTADYLLAHRIPKPVQALLKALPAPLAARLLLAAIRRNAWTFAGSGDFRATAGRPCVLTIHNNPLCRGAMADSPACDFYAATFERLFQVLVHRQATATEMACEARGDPICRFELRW
jgi:divinyl protochlorophyllide a 8-vinyl-reductase